MKFNFCVPSTRTQIKLDLQILCCGVPPGIVLGPHSFGLHIKNKQYFSFIRRKLTFLEINVTFSDNVERI